MANIDNELSQIRSSIYGNEMRDAIYNSIDKINNANNSHVNFNDMQNLNDAQKQTARDNIGAVSAYDVNNAPLIYYNTETELTVYAAAEGWKLDGTGKCAQDSLYKIVKYEATPGETLYLKLLKDGGGVYQWQNAVNVPSSLPNNSLVGTPVTTAIDGNVIVPSGATHLIVSQYKANSTNSVKLIEIESKTIKDAIREKVDVDQGAENAGKILAVNSDGIIEPLQSSIGLGAVGMIMLGTNWSNTNPHIQTVTVSGYDVTNNTKVDLLVTPDSLTRLASSGVTGIQAVNDNGVITIYEYGGFTNYAMSLYCSCNEINTYDDGIILPPEYQRVQYIQVNYDGNDNEQWNTNAAYIKTDIVADNETYMAIDFRLNDSVIGRTPATESHNGCNYQYQNRFMIGYADDAWWWGVGSTKIVGATIDTRRHISYIDSKNNKVGIDGIETPFSGSYTGSSTKICIFATGYNNGEMHWVFEARIYDVVIKTKTVDAHFIPCYKKQTGTIGFYDIERNRFFSNANPNSDDFVKGADV